jgi:hypothetical protein
MDIKIEMVLRKSTLADIIGPWVAMGKPDNREAGGFIFDNVVSYNYIGNHIDIHTEDATYVYNLSDFYRVKITRG